MASNGKTYDTLWMPPLELDVTDALKAGKTESRCALLPRRKANREWVKRFS